MSSTSPLTERTELLDARVLALTHYLPHYMTAVLAEVAQQTREFSMLLSTRLEPNRHFDTDWRGLQVTVQKSLMVRRSWRHSVGFKDELYVHVPYDTYSQLKRAQPDIVFSYELGVRTMVSAIYRRLHPRSRLAICVCVSEHTEQGRGTPRHLLRRWLVRQADAITYNGPSCRNYLKRFPIPDDKLFSFPYAQVSDSRFTGPLERCSTNSHRLVCIGQLIERKGVMPLLASVNRYCAARPSQLVDLTFIGTGPLEAKLKSTAAAANLRLQFIGHIPAPQLSGELAKFGVMVFPTLADEWGLVVNEAMQAGLPVLGSPYAQSSTTLIREGENGWLYDPLEETTLFSKLDTVFALSTEALNKIRYAARETVQDITTHSSAEKALQMFRVLLADLKSVVHR